jgi:hypothetical protein
MPKSTPIEQVDCAIDTNEASMLNPVPPKPLSAEYFDGWYADLKRSG